MRRLLLLTYHFPPSSASGTFRMLGFARHLPRYGWQTIVVAPPSLPWEPDDPELLRQVPLETVLFPVPYRRGSLLQRLAPFSAWLPRALAASRTAIREYRPDAVLTSGPPHQIHLLGLALSRRYKLPWVADFRDPWVVDGRPRQGHNWRSSCAARLERAVLQSADAIIANVPNAGAVIAEAYPTLGHKVATVCNGYDRETFEVAPCDSALEHDCSSIEVVHTGALYAGRDARPFLDAVAALVREPQDLPHRPWRVTLLGPRPEDPALDLDAEIHRRGLGSVVTIGGQVSYARALAAMRHASILLLIDSPGRKIGVPAKVYEYIGAGRPILALGEPGGDLAWVLEESGVPHRIASPTNPAAIRRALAALVRSSAGSVGPAEGGELRFRFTREVLAGRLAEILDRCIEPTSPRGLNDHAGTPHEVALTTAR